jgi:peptidoglycan/LPS O-acetylase OafA/YrhL
MPSTSVAPKNQALTYRPGIDGMRAVAVLGVVLYHAGFGPPGGFVGVDVFFVISGFLITSLLEAELDRTGRVDIAAFYARRIRRLLPALAIVLLATTGASFAILSPYGELSDALRSVAASAVFVANIFFQYTTGDYFGPNASHLPLLHLWSLGVEEQYYLIWPVALYLARRLPLWARFAMFAVCAGCSMAFAEWAIQHGSQAAFYAMPSRWWELSLGAAVAWTPRAGTSAVRAEGLGGLLLILLAMAFPTQHFPGLGALPAVIGAALLAHASATRGGVWRILASRPMLIVGRSSYALYLWHWPLLALAAVAVPGDLPPATRVALVLTAMVLALATWRFVETPLRHVSLALPRQLVGATLLASIGVAAVSFQSATVLQASPPPRDAASLAARDVPTNIAECHASSLAPVSAPDEDTCSLGGHGTPRIMIWGDSHALAFQPFVTALAQRDHMVAIGYTRDACAPALDFDNGKGSARATLCKAFNAEAFKRAITMDTVVLASRWPRPDQRQFGEDLTDTVRRLAPHVRRIFIIGATPDLPASVPDCLHRNALDACALPRDTFLQQSAAIRGVLASFPSQFPNVVYIETTEFFCEKQTCPGVRGGMALYWDDHHISSTAASAFGNSFLRGISRSAL